MKIIKILCYLFFTQQIANAQHIKLSLTQGIGVDANIKNDSLFLAKNYYATQLRVGYHYGKLGVIANVRYIHQQNGSDSANGDERIPVFFQQFPRQYANVNTLMANLGIELCLPIIKRKAQLNIYATYGLSRSTSDSVAFTSGQETYAHTAESKLMGCVQLGVSINYKINARLGLKWQNEYCQYSLPFNELDSRKTINTLSGVQAKNLWISSIGVQYIL